MASNQEPRLTETPKLVAASIRRILLSGGVFSGQSDIAAAVLSVENTYYTSKRSLESLLSQIFNGNRRAFPERLLADITEAAKRRACVHESFSTDLKRAVAEYNAAHNSVEIFQNSKHRTVHSEDLPLKAKIARKDKVFYVVPRSRELWVSLPSISNAYGFIMWMLMEYGSIFSGLTLFQDDSYRPSVLGYSGEPHIENDSFMKAAADQIRFEAFCCDKRDATVIMQSVFYSVYCRLTYKRPKVEHQAILAAACVKLDAIRAFRVWVVPKASRIFLGTAVIAANPGDKENEHIFAVTDGLPHRFAPFDAENWRSCVYSKYKTIIKGARRYYWEDFARSPDNSFMSG